MHITICFCQHVWERGNKYVKAEIGPAHRILGKVSDLKTKTVLSGNLKVFFPIAN